MDVMLASRAYGSLDHGLDWIVPHKMRKMGDIHPMHSIGPPVAPRLLIRRPSYWLSVGKGGSPNAVLGAQTLQPPGNCIARGSVARTARPVEVLAVLLK
jgi:hypothetical protein